MSTSVLTRPVARRRPVPPDVLVALAAAALAYGAARWAFVGADFWVFRAAGSAALHGASPYDFALDGIFRYLYTPFAALAFAPLALLGERAALAVWTLASVLALLAVVRVSLRLAGVTEPRRRTRLTLLVTLAVLPLTPVLQNLWLGQINLILLLLVLGDLGRGPGRWRGVGVGIAAGIKLTPLIFVGYLLLTRQFRAASTALASFGATVAIGFAVLPTASRTYWGGTFLDTGRMYPTPAARPWNQSLSGLLVHHHGWWLPVAAVVGLAGLLVAAAAGRRGDQLAGLVTCGITGVLVSPLSWPPHWVWCVPLLVLAGRRGLASGRLPAAVPWLAFAAPTYFWVTPALLARPLNTAVPPELFAWLAVGTGLGVLAALALRPRTPRQEPALIAT